MLAWILQECRPASLGPRALQKQRNRSTMLLSRVKSHTCPFHSWREFSRPRFSCLNRPQVDGFSMFSPSNVGFSEVKKTDPLRKAALELPSMGPRVPQTLSPWLNALKSEISTSDFPREIYGRWHRFVAWCNHLRMTLIQPFYLQPFIKKVTFFGHCFYLWANPPECPQKIF